MHRKNRLEYVESFELWCWKWMEKVIWAYRMKKQAVLHTYIPKERNTIHKITQWKDIWMCHILHRNCLLTNAIENKIAVTGRRGRRRKKLTDDLTEREDTVTGT
jgi:hypothetical protein